MIQIFTFSLRLPKLPDPRAVRTTIAIHGRGWLTSYAGLRMLHHFQRRAMVTARHRLPREPEDL